MALKFANNNSLSAITSVPSGVGGGSLNLISTQTASSSSTISFTSNIDSTYKEYIIKFTDVHAETDQASFTFNLSVDSGSNYNVTKTTSYHRAYHYENDSAAVHGYHTGSDLAQSTGEQILLNGAMSTDNDHCLVGFIHIFEPSSTVFVKHFISTIQMISDQNYSYNAFIAGYGNTTSAIDAIRFKMSSGKIDSGTFKLYGVS